MDVPRCHSPFALPGHIPTDLSKGLFEGDCGEGRVAIILESTKKQVRNADVKAFGGSKRPPSCRSNCIVKIQGNDIEWMKRQEKQSNWIFTWPSNVESNLVTKNSASMEYTDLWDTSTTPSPILQIFFPKIKGPQKKILGSPKSTKYAPTILQEPSAIYQRIRWNFAPTGRPLFRPQLLWPHCEADCLLHQICVHLVIPNTGKVDTLMTKSWEGPKAWKPFIIKSCKDGKLWEDLLSDSRFNPTISYLVDKFIALHKRIVTETPNFQSHTTQIFSRPLASLQSPSISLVEGIVPLHHALECLFIGDGDVLKDHDQTWLHLFLEARDSWFQPKNDLLPMIFFPTIRSEWNVEQN